ncbi:ABC transporter permease subunit [Actinosynnema sp. NPDC023658]|uniref:ABC transporter permease n=1 Tax=Actinosynnema sp. NPDC023658 TaxID=3155465 RepID=UPI0033C11590
MTALLTAQPTVHDDPSADERPRRRGSAPRRAAELLLTAFGKVVAIAVLLTIWETAPRLGLVDATFLPPFSTVLGAWWDLAVSGQLSSNAGASLVRSLSGFGLAVVVAVPLGLLIGWYKPVATLLGPLLEVFRNTAALALLPVFVLLLGIGETSKIAIVFYACTWPVLLNTISAVRGVDPTLLRLMSARGSTWADW